MSSSECLAAEKIPNRKSSSQSSNLMQACFKSCDVTNFVSVRSLVMFVRVSLSRKVMFSCLLIPSYLQSSGSRIQGRRRAKSWSTRAARRTALWLECSKGLDTFCKRCSRSFCSSLFCEQKKHCIWSNWDPHNASKSRNVSILRWQREFESSQGQCNDHWVIYTSVLVQKTVCVSAIEIPLHIWHSLPSRSTEPAWPMSLNIGCKSGQS